MEYLLGHSWCHHLDVDGAFIWTFMKYLWNIHWDMYVVFMEYWAFYGTFIRHFMEYLLYISCYNYWAFFGLIDVSRTMCWHDFVDGELICAVHFGPEP